MEQGNLQVTPLHSAHKKLSARLVPFAGFEMPVQYTSIISESKAVRSQVGMFDVSHMGRLTIQGEGALGFLEKVTTNDVGRLDPNTGQYSLLPNPHGGCVDDIILYRDVSAFQMVVNASNHQKALDWLRSNLSPSTSIEDITRKTAMIAVQGPAALEVLSKISCQREALSNAAAFGVLQLTIGKASVQAARSGYTGEDGFELICSSEDAESVWDLLLNEGVQPCGLGSRDTLRVEAGLPLYGHELSDELSPIAAGLGWVVSKSKAFIGSEEYNRVREQGPASRLVGVTLEIKRLIQPDMKVLVEDQEVGSVTSGVISPTLDTAIALAFVDSSLKIGTPCSIAARGKNEPGKIVGKRFYKRAAA